MDAAHKTHPVNIYAMLDQRRRSLLLQLKKKSVSHWLFYGMVIGRES